VQIARSADSGYIAEEVVVQKRGCVERKTKDTVLQRRTVEFASLAGTFFPEPSDGTQQK